MKKRLFVCCLLLFLLFLLTGCGYTKEEKSLIKQYKEQGKENSINYIKEKYGMNAKVKSVTVCSKEYSLFPDSFSEPSETVQVKMNANGKNFYVYITAKEESTEGQDNYQFEEIKKDLVDSINNLVQIPVYKYEISGAKSIMNTEGLLDKNEYYDGNNLGTIAGKLGINLFMHYIGDVDFSNIDFSSISDITNNIILMLINYDSKSDYENSIKLTSNLQLFSPRVYVKAGGDYIKSTVAFYQKEKYYFKNGVEIEE